MSQIFLPPTIQILAYRTFTINSQASVASGHPVICGDSLHIADPLADRPNTEGRNYNIKDIPPQIRAVASNQEKLIRQSEHDIRVKWFADDRVYFKDPMFTFGMVRVVDPDISILGSLPIQSSHSGLVNTGACGQQGFYDPQILGSGYIGPSASDGDIEMGFIEPEAASVSSLKHRRHHQHHQASSTFADAQEQDVSGHNGSAVPAQVIRVKQGVDNGYGGSGGSSSSAAHPKKNSRTDGKFVQPRIKREDGDEAACFVKGIPVSEDGEGISGMYGPYAT
ncbi:hypothetical protein TWF730_008211 [Orbilia blumenaviensis]|uniref:Uncharacterized protein n=1 Tax=Orbilia blumenaviensis TaxID=1796055 RepID=A0AAV9V3Z2_9PEZI